MARVWGRMVATAGGGAVVLLATLAGAAAADTGVTGHDAADTFIVSGSASGSATRAGGGCSGCARVIWVPACLTTSPSLVLAGPGADCMTVGDETCPGDRRFLREWTSGSGGWVPGDARCRAVSGGVSLAVVAAIVRDAVAHRVPAPSITTQPERRPLVAVPVLFHSGQPDTGLTWRDDVAGVSVTTQVDATWRWWFGDGSQLQTDRAGSRWPDTDVGHTYHRPGRYTVGVEVQWSGTFEISGLAPQAIDGAVTQGDSVSVRVGTAGARFRPALP